MPPRKPVSKTAITAQQENAAVRTISAFIAIHEHAGKQRGIASTIPCPSCKGELQYRISKSNGHIMARCSTKGCTAFMQ